MLASIALLLISASNARAIDSIEALDAACAAESAEPLRFELGSRRLELESADAPGGRPPIEALGGHARLHLVGSEALGWEGAGRLGDARAALETGALSAALVATLASAEELPACFGHRALPYRNVALTLVAVELSGPGGRAVGRLVPREDAPEPLVPVSASCSFGCSLDAEASRALVDQVTAALERCPKTHEAIAMELTRVEGRLEATGLIHEPSAAATAACLAEDLAENLGSTVAVRLPAGARLSILVAERSTAPNGGAERI